MSRKRLNAGVTEIVILFNLVVVALAIIVNAAG